MSDQHFLPASYVGRFSVDANRPWRKRRVWVQRAGYEPYRASAEYVAEARRFYDWEHANWPWPSIDENWKYEARLPSALDRLANSTKQLDGRTWAQVLVPFVSSLFVRGPDFRDRYAARIPGITGPDPENPAIRPIVPWHDNALVSLQIEWQRLLAPVMAAQWTIVHGSGAPVLATNDAARCLMLKRNRPGEIAYAIPIDTATVLVLENRLVRRLFDWDGSQWIASVDHRTMQDDELNACRHAIREAAYKEVYGPTRKSVAFSTPSSKPRSGPVGPEYLYPSSRPRALIPYSEDYFRALTFLELEPQHISQRDDEIDWSTAAQHWGNELQLFMNVPRFPGGLAMVLNPATSVWSIYLDLTRFAALDVDRYRGKEELEQIDDRASPALAALLENEIRQSGTRKSHIQREPRISSPVSLTLAETCASETLSQRHRKGPSH